MATTHENAPGAEANPGRAKEILIKPDTLTRLADGDRMLGKAREGGWEPNLSAIARRAGVDKGTLSRFASGDQGLTKKIIEVVIEASGKHWLDALAEYFVYDIPRAQAAEECEDLAAAA